MHLTFLHTWQTSRRGWLSCLNSTLQLLPSHCTRSPHSKMSKQKKKKDFLYSKSGQQSSISTVTNTISYQCLHPPCSVHCAAFSAASRQYACGFADSSLHVWSLSPGATSTSSSSFTMDSSVRSTVEHSVLLGHHAPLYGTCFSSDGHFLLSTSEDCSVRLWNVQRKSSVVSYRGHSYPVWDAAFRYLNYVKYLTVSGILTMSTNIRMSSCTFVVSD